MRIVGHIDLDAFFATVEEREKPYLKGLPIIVGSDPLGGAGRGVVSTASYAARAYGVRSAVPISKAWQLCQEAQKKGNAPCVFITPRHKKYSDASSEAFGLIGKLVRIVEQVSVDEAYLDFSHCSDYPEATRIARTVQKSICDIGLSCSVGIGPNKLIAKLASEVKKPRGLTVVLPQKVDMFLKPLAVRDIPGIGKKAEEKFARLGVRTVADARKISWEELRRAFGAHGFELYERLRGIDEREVQTEKEDAKSIGKHHTFDVDTDDMKEVFEVLSVQAKSIVRSLIQDGFISFRTVVITVRFADFSTVSRMLTVQKPLTSVVELELKAIKLALPFFDAQENPRKKKIRLVGLRIEKLS
ncbi:MAG: DNA polymerase IV [Patescibacteria group bacterium]